MGQIYSLTSDEAEKIMEAAMETLKTQFNVASISIVNRDGTEIAKAVMDGVRPFTTYVALMKAKQAAYIGKATGIIASEVKKWTKTLGVLDIDFNNFVQWKGGVPVYDQEGHLLGGLGVSNLDQENDDAVAENAICKAGFKVAADYVPWR